MVPEGISSHLISSHLISSHLISSHLISSHLISSHLISSHLISDQIISDQIRSDLIRSHQIRPDQIRSDQIRSDQIRSDQIRSDQIRSDQIRSDQIRSDQIRSDQIRSDQIRSDQIRSDQDQITAVLFLDLCDLRCVTVLERQRCHSNAVCWLTVLCQGRGVERAKWLNCQVERSGAEHLQRADGAHCCHACSTPGTLFVETCFLVGHLFCFPQGHRVFCSCMPTIN